MSNPEMSFAAMRPDGSGPAVPPPEPTAAQPELQQELPPIHEDQSSVSYLGVRLEKAQLTDSPHIPDRKKYDHYINDQWALEFQRKIATAFISGEPIIVEGGTSIGKTTTVRKMAAELSWEVHYVNLNGATDVEDLMGRYIPNAKRKYPEDPEYAFADGKVTSGLRQQEGRTKVIILDEFNATAPNILIRLHEVIDALERDSDVILSEDASEAVQVSKERTKVIALMNPPGQGFIGREPLDKAQLRRWLYQKEATELPKETFNYSTKALFGLEKEMQEIKTSGYLPSRSEALTLAQMTEIPGLPEITDLYIEFHAGAKAIVNARQFAADQPQPFTFDDREEPRRISDFIRRFYNGDISETFQAALKFIYQNKLESAADRKKFDELIAKVAYVPPIDSRRRSFERTKPAEAGESAAKLRMEAELTDALARPDIPEAVKAVLSGAETSLPAEIEKQIEEARRILGRDVLGPEEIKAAFKLEKLTEIPPIQFTKDALERAKELGQMLVLRQPFTMAEILTRLEGKLKDGKVIINGSGAGGKVIGDSWWFKDEKFFTEERPAAQWALVSKELVPDSTSKNYLQQTDQLVQYLQNEVFKHKVLPREYEDAIKEYQAARTGIEAILTSDWKKAAAQLEGLKITQLTRHTPAELMWDAVAYFQTNDKRLHEHTYAWTGRRESVDGRLVYFGRFGGGGARVHGWRPYDSDDGVGVVFSRSL